VQDCSCLYRMKKTRIC